MSQRFIMQPGGKLSGRLQVPGDKSISHRAIMLGSLAQGRTDVAGFLNGEDCLCTMKAFQSMGVGIEQLAETRLRILGSGLHGLKRPTDDLDLGNSGTSMRLMAGVLSGQAFDTVLTGDASLRRRPMKRVTAPLALMGAGIETTADGTAPLAIRGGQVLKGIEYTMPVASAQVKSCLLLAGMYAQGDTLVVEPAPSRDHTERMLMGFGYSIEREGAGVRITGGGSLSAAPVVVPGDVSSAAFFMVGAAIVPGSELIIQDVGVNPTRTGIIHILRLMGAEIEMLRLDESGAEPRADIRVRGCGLKGVHIPESQVPLAIDEFPAIFIAAACAEGETVLTGAEELRVKESDRIAVMADGLKALGVHAETTPDGMVIRGGRLSGGQVDSHGDHRVAMSFAIAALRASGQITVNDCANVNTSFPGFASLASQAGLDIRVEGS